MRRRATVHEKSSSGIEIFSGTVPPRLAPSCRYGKVADPEVTDKNTEALRELNAFLLRDERVTFSLVPVGDGIALCTVR